MISQTERLKFCSTCLNRNFNHQKGLLCGLTMEKPIFEDSCPDYSMDIEQIKKNEEKKSLDQNQSIFSEANDAVEFYQVGKEIRFLNYLIDSVVLFFFSAVIAVFSSLVLGIGYDFDEETSKGASSIWDYIFTGIASLIYYPVFEGMLGRTIGKMATNCKVVNIDGTKPELSTIFLRTLCRFIPFEIFSFLGRDPIGWHDTITKTRVVKMSYDHSIESSIDQIGIPDEDKRTF